MPHRKLLEEHVHLRVLSDRLRVLLAAPSATLTTARWHKLLDHEIGGLADALADHFDREEQGGYLRDILKDHPELSARADEFLAHHDSMRASVESMIAAVEGGAGVRELRSPLKALLAMLATHEARETELIQDAMQRDTGPGD